MRRRLRAPVAAPSALPPAPAVAPSARAAGPVTGTDGFPTDPEADAKRRVGLRRPRRRAGVRERRGAGAGAGVSAGRFLPEATHQMIHGY